MVLVVDVYNNDYVYLTLIQHIHCHGNAMHMYIHTYVYIYLLTTSAVLEYSSEGLFRAFFLLGML